MVGYASVKLVDPQILWATGLSDFSFCGISEAVDQDHQIIPTVQMTIRAKQAIRNPLIEKVGFGNRFISESLYEFESFRSSRSSQSTSRFIETAKKD